MKVVTAQFAEDKSQGVVTVESDRTDDFGAAIDELMSADARNLATGFAITQGVADARINGLNQAPYPVNAEGKSLEQVVDDKGNPLAPAHPRMQPARYRTDIQVCRRAI